jgi:hypothetical protein
LSEVTSIAAFLILGRTTATSVLESDVIGIGAFLLFSGNASLTPDDELLSDDSSSSDSINIIDVFSLPFRSFLTVLALDSDLETEADVSSITFSSSGAGCDAN